MARSNADVFPLLSELYRAGLGEIPWDKGLQALASFFGAAGASMFDLDRATGRIPEIHTYGLGPTEGEYAERMNAINPRMHSALVQPGIHTSFDYASLPEEALRRNEFYDWLERACGVKYFIGSRTIDAGEISSFIAVEFDARHGHAESDDIELYRLLSPHFANARRVTRISARLAGVEGVSEALQEVVNWGVVGLNGHGRVVTMNARAQALIGRCDGLTVENGLLRALRAAENRALNLIIAHALRTATGEGIFPGRTVTIPRRSARMPYVVRVVPTRCAGAALPDGTPVILVVISDPDGHGVPRPQELATVFRLTPREAELAALLAAQVSLSAAAERMGIARNTARVHLRNILQKTGTGNQASMIGLIRSLPPGI